MRAVFAHATSMDRDIDLTKMSAAEYIETLKRLPTIEDQAEWEIRNNADKYLYLFYRKSVLSRGIGYDEEEIDIEVQKILLSVPEQEKANLIEGFVRNAREIAYRSILQNNYDQIFREVAHIVKSELSRIRSLRIENDPRIYDPTYGL